MSIRTREQQRLRRSASARNGGPSATVPVQTRPPRHTKSPPQMNALLPLRMSAQSSSQAATMSSSGFPTPPSLWPAMSSPASSVRQLEGLLVLSAC